ncbi:unnamed protein product [Chrysoparadoxa australica]
MPKLGDFGGQSYDVWRMREDDGEAYEGWYVGIDLGTTFSCIALWHVTKNRVKIFKLDGNARIMPSMVYEEEDGSMLVGHEALRRSQETRVRPVSSAKRVIGLRYDDPLVESMAPDMPVAVECDEETGMAVLEVPGSCGSISPVEVSAAVLATLKSKAEAWVEKRKIPGLSAPLDACVVTVPVQFNEARRRATRDAARAAGFRHAVTLAESTAAAMAYGLFVAGTKTVLTFDMGGGTLDVSIMAIDEGKFEVLATAGDAHLGGEDMDQRLLEWALDETLPKAADREALSDDLIGRLRRECSKLKEKLSEVTSADIHFGDECHDCEGLREKGGIDFRLRIERRKFESLIQDELNRAREVVLCALDRAGLKPGGVDAQEVILVGGCSRIPAVRAMLTELFPGKELCTAVDPDQAVAEGAAIRGAILSGVDHGLLKDILMLDALPLDIGVETADGEFEVLLERNASIPATGSKTFYLEDSQQKGVTIEVYEGDKAAGAQRAAVGRFVFMLVRVDPSKVPQGKDGEQRSVEVTFTMTAQGALRVGIKDSWEAYGARYTDRQVMCLAFYCVVLAVVYLYVKIVFGAQLRLDQYAAADESVSTGRVALLQRDAHSTQLILTLPDELLMDFMAQAQGARGAMEQWRSSQGT